MRELLLAIIAVYDGITGRIDPKAERPRDGTSMDSAPAMPAAQVFGQSGTADGRPADGRPTDGRPFDTPYEAMIASEVAVMSARLTQARALLSHVEDPGQALAAAPLYFGVMPRIDQYQELIPWLCIVFLPLLYLQSSPNPKTMILVLFSSVVPERAFLQQVRSFFAGCSQLMQGVQGSVPGNNLAQTQALIESIEYMVLRLASAVHFRQQSIETLDEQLLKQLRPVYDACIESLQVMSNSLAELKPIPELPDTKSLFRELEFRGDDLRRPAAREAGDQASVFSFMSATSQLRSLIDAIHDCRDKANALDWEAWNRNYF